VSTWSAEKQTRKEDLAQDSVNLERGKANKKLQQEWSREITWQTKPSKTFPKQINQT